MDVRVHDDELTAESAATGLTSLEDETTDEFGRRLVQTAREQQIIHNARSAKPQPFSRARPRQRLTWEVLQRSHPDKENAGAGEVLSSPPASISSGERSDPPLNIPRAWGRRAQKNHAGWLRKIPHLGDDGQNSSSEDDLVLPRKTSYTGDGTPHTIDWTKAAADVPIPTTEGSPSPFRYAQGTPPSMQKQNDSSTRLQEWNVDDDFTANSLIASTPARKQRNTALDEIRIRELETVEEVSVLEEVSPVHRSPPLSAQKQRLSSSEALISSSTPGLPQGIQLPKRGTAGDLNAKSTVNDGAQKADLNPSSPVVILSSEDYAKSSTPKRPQPHQRSDSLDLLKRLSRATSGTPSPGRIPPQSQTERRPQIESEQPSSTAKKDIPRQSSVEQRSTPCLSKSPRRTVRESSTGRSPSRQIASTTNKALEEIIPPIEDPVDPHTPLPHVLEADQNRVDVLNAKTPVVTGAWIDTPAPATAKRTSISPRKTNSSFPVSPAKSSSQMQSKVHSLPTPDPQMSPRKRHSPRKPSLPTSALAAVVEGARPAKQDDETITREFPIGDSTINSLEDIIDSSILEAPQAARAAATADDENNTETITLPLHLASAGAKPRNAAERQRWKEMEQVARMNAQLRAARSNIRDARVGLRRFENALSSPETSRERGTGRADGCGVCGCPGGSSPFAPTLSWCKALFVKPLDSTAASPASKGAFLRPFHRGRQRLTLFSIALLLLLCYVFAEAALCSQFCHPRYAHSMRGYGVDPNAPRLPFVVVTLLFRPLRWAWKPALNTVVASGGDALRAAGILPEQPLARRWGAGRPKKMTRATWESLTESAAETEMPGLKALVTETKAVDTEPQVQAQTHAGTMSWVQSLRAQASQVWDDVEWSKMDDDEVL